MFLSASKLKIMLPHLSLLLLLASVYANSTTSGNITSTPSCLVKSEFVWKDLIILVALCVACTLIVTLLGIFLVFVFQKVRSRTRSDNLNI